MTANNEGGKPPFRISFIPLGNAPLEALKNNALLNERFPYVSKKTDWTLLAIVGSGESAEAGLDELRNWPGDIWAINGACSWLSKHGIKSELVSVDPSSFPEYMLEGVESGILASCVDNRVFERLEGNAEKFDLIEYSDDGISGGSSTACRLPQLAISLGYTEVVYFGCEGSFVGKDHVYKHYGSKDQIIIKVGGGLFKTAPGMLLQCLSLSQLMREWPEIFKEKSGGLLRAMIADLDTWEVVAVSASIKQKIEESSGKRGFYETPYFEEETCLSS